MKKLIAFAVLAAHGAFAGATTVRIAEGENWWGAANYFGRQMPFTSGTKLSVDLRKSNYHNQCASASIVIDPSLKDIVDGPSDHITRPWSERRSDAHWLW